MSVMKEEVFTQLRENRRYNIPLHDAQEATSLVRRQKEQGERGKHGPELLLWFLGKESMTQDGQAGASLGLDSLSNL